jgi:hypothetical protein
MQRQQDVGLVGDVAMQRARDGPDDEDVITKGD